MELGHLEPGGGNVTGFLEDLEGGGENKTGRVLGDHQQSQSVSLCLRYIIS